MVAPMENSSLLRSVALMALAMSLIPGGDTAGKWLTSRMDVSPFFVAWTRFALGALFFLPFSGLRREELRLLVDWRLVLRALFIVGGVSSILTALRTEGIATVFGAFFIGPVLSYAASALLLRERVGLGRSLLLLAGFGGVLLVVRPGFGMTAGTGFALLAGVFYGSYLTASRWLRERARPRALLLSQLAVGAVALTPAGLAAMPGAAAPWPALGILVVISALASMLGNLLLIFAYRGAEASRLAPLVYFQLIAATLLGVLVFGELPDRLALIGLGVLLLSGFGSLALRR